MRKVGGKGGIVLALIMVLAIGVASAELAPSVQLRPIKDVAEVGEPCIFEASIVNPISPDGKNMTAQIILKVPPNVIVYGKSFSQSGSGQYVAIFKNIPPGDAVYERVFVKGLQPGEYIVSADLIWYYEGEKTPHITSLDYSVKFTGKPTPTPTPKHTPTPPHNDNDDKSIWEMIVEILEKHLPLLVVAFIAVVAIVAFVKIFKS